MKYVSIFFEDPFNGSIKQFPEKCHSLHGDLGKFIIAKTTPSNETVFLNKDSFFNEVALDQCLFDNRFTLFNDLSQAETKLKELQNKPYQNEVSYLIYRVKNDTHDSIHLQKIK